MKPLTSHELKQVARRAEEIGGAVNYHFALVASGPFKKSPRRLRVVQAVVMTSTEKYALGREIKEFKRGQRRRERADA